jgi:hypothetical protein
MDGNHLHAKAATGQVAVDQLAFVGLRGKPIPIRSPSLATILLTITSR